MTTHAQTPQPRPGFLALHGIWWPVCDTITVYTGEAHARFDQWWVGATSAHIVHRGSPSDAWECVDADVRQGDEQWIELNLATIDNLDEPFNYLTGSDVDPSLTMRSAMQWLTEDPAAAFVPVSQLVQEARDHGIDLPELAQAAARLDAVAATPLPELPPDIPADATSDATSDATLDDCHLPVLLEDADYTTPQTVSDADEYRIRVHRSWQLTWRGLRRGWRAQIESAATWKDDGDVELIAGRGCWSLDRLAAIDWALDEIRWIHEHDAPITGPLLVRAGWGTLVDERPKPAPATPRTHCGCCGHEQCTRAVQAFRAALAETDTSQETGVAIDQVVAHLNAAGFQITRRPEADRP